MTFECERLGYTFLKRCMMLSTARNTRMHAVMAQSTALGGDGMLLPLSLREATQPEIIELADPLITSPIVLLHKSDSACQHEGGTWEWN